jgi:PIN domain nuclease of toxin-antitoxin system
VSEIVLDASALLALIRGEEGADTVAPFLGSAAMSTVNLAEAYGRLLREMFRPDEIRRDFEALELELHPFSAEQAFAAGKIEPATRSLGLALGDRVCLALALTLRLPVMTADRQWRKVDVGVEVRLIR